MVTRDETNDKEVRHGKAQERGRSAASCRTSRSTSPSVEGRELDYVQEVVRGGHLSSGR